MVCIIAEDFNLCPFYILLPSKFPCTGGISDVRSISGLITSVCQVYFRYESSPLLSPTQFRPPDDYKSDYTFVILLACVLVGIMLGLGVAIGCVSKMFNSNQTVGSHSITILIFMNAFHV